MRIFISIDCPRDIKEYLIDTQKKIVVDYATLSLTKSFHLTLKFLGDISEDCLMKVKKILSEIRFHKLTLTLDKLGFFQNPNYINVIWMGVKQHDEITKLQRYIEDSLIGLFPKDKFHPHITLARVKSISDKKRFVTLINGIKIQERDFVVDRFLVYQSFLKYSAPEYKLIEEFITHERE